jgi:hypothetical protein
VRANIVIKRIVEHIIESNLGNTFLRLGNHTTKVIVGESIFVLLDLLNRSLIVNGVACLRVLLLKVHIASDRLVLWVPEICNQLRNDLSLNHFDSNK